MTTIVRTMVNQLKMSSNKADLCPVCRKKPRFVENGFKHPYCSRTCARNGSGQSPNACQFHGCRATGKPAFGGYCSDAHGKDAVTLKQVKGCDDCGLRPGANGPLCIPCQRQTLIPAPAVLTPSLKELHERGTTLRELRVQFKSEWDSPSGDVPDLFKVYEVLLPAGIRRRYEDYGRTLGLYREIRTFYGSQCICDMGTKGTTLCEFKSCGICSVVKSSFDLFAFQETSNNGRFGDGIYSYQNPYLANTFSTSCTSSPYRVLVACDVIVGADVQVPFEESLFVPGSEAIVPSYILMYTVK